LLPGRSDLRPALSAFSPAAAPSLRITGLRHRSSAFPAAGTTPVQSLPPPLALSRLLSPKKVAMSRLLRVLFLPLLHLLGQAGRVLLIHHIVQLEGSVHVVGTLEAPFLIGIGVGELRGLPLLILLVQRVGPGRIHDLHGAAHAPLHQVSRERAVLSQSNLVLLALHGAADG